MQKFHVKQLLLASLLSLIIFPTIAQKMYRCPSTGGGTTFSDTPCANNAGGEISVKPASGAAKPQPKPDPQTRGAMDKRAAEYEAMLSPECRRARQAFEAKTREKGGMEELMKDGNPISKAWEDCTFEAKDAVGKLNAKDQAALQTEESKRRAQDRMTQQKLECATKRKTLDERSARVAQLSDQDLRALAALTADIQLNCR
jgi:Domain of unknown function (DUF4124)